MVVRERLPPPHPHPEVRTVREQAHHELSAGLERATVGQTKPTSGRFGGSADHRWPTWSPEVGTPRAPGAPSRTQDGGRRRVGTPGTACARALGCARVRLRLRRSDGGGRHGVTCVWALPYAHDTISTKHEVRRYVCVVREVSILEVYSPPARLRRTRTSRQHPCLPPGARRYDGCRPT